VGGPTARAGGVLGIGLSIHRAHLRRNLAPIIPPSTTQGGDYPAASPPSEWTFARRGACSRSASSGISL